MKENYIEPIIYTLDRFEAEKRIGDNKHKWVNSWRAHQQLKAVILMARQKADALIIPKW